MRVVVATVAMAVLSDDPMDRARQVLPVLRFIEAAWWTGLGYGRLCLAAAYAGQPAERAIDLPPPMCGSK